MTVDAAASERAAGPRTRPFRPTPLTRLRSASNTVRGRTALAALLVVGMALLVAAATLVTLLRDLLADQVEMTARVRSMEVAAGLATGQLLELQVSDLEDELVQVFAADGAVVMSTRNVAGLPPLAAPDSRAVEINGPLPESPLLVVSSTASTPSGRLTVLVGNSLDPVNDATEAVGWLVLGGLPIMLLVIGMTTWVLTGRALAPVEAIRAEVDDISAAGLDRRVPNPPGEDEIARLARTMNRMLGRLERAQQRQNRFVADASHELRSPVAAIRQHAEVALAHPSRAQTVELAEAVHTEGLRIQRLIDDLLLLARVDEQGLALHRDPVDLDDLVFEEAARLRASTELRIDTSAVSAGRVDGDRSALRRLLLNLGENAARHAGGQVSFSLAERADGVVMAVTDDGPGIPPAQRERVLERFVRLDEARARDGGGSGLGLAIVADLVSAHRGRLEIGDGPGGGARVALTFPGSSDRA